MIAASQSGLPRYALFAGMLAFVGLPIYIYAPKFFVDEYGVSLTALGFVLLGVRMIDFVQDPLLGKLSDRLRSFRPSTASLAACVLAVSFLGLFMMTPPINPLVWFFGCVTVAFTAFSLLSIMFYAQGVKKALDVGEKGHLKVAVWRETGSLIGISLACIAPLALQIVFPESLHPLAMFALAFVLVCTLATVFMYREWSVSRPVHVENSWGLLQDRVLLRLLVIVFLNAAPAAVTASLFLFFVEYGLASQEAAGPLLLVYFLSAALFAPLWGKVALRYGAKKVLLFAMLTPIPAFAFAFGLGQGQVLPFAIVCVVSGASLGADMTLLPAIFARRIEQMSHSEGQAFGAWNFCAKATLAISAATMFPALEFFGFSAGSENSESALFALSFLYALVPCFLKFAAFVCLALTKLEEV